MKNETFRKKILSSCFYLVFFHISICFITQAAISSLSYRLPDLKNEEQELAHMHEKLALDHSSQTALIKIYPQIKEKQYKELEESLDLTGRDSFALR